MTDDEKEFELTKLEFEKIFELRKFEIDNFWKRGWFFGALILAFTTGYFTLKQIKPDSNDLSDYCIYVSFITFLISLAQSLMNRGSKYWQERWEYKTKNREEKKLKLEITSSTFEEKKYIEACILDKDENLLARGRRFSVSKLTFLVWDIITVAWLFIWIQDWNLLRNKIDIWSNFHWSDLRVGALVFHLGILIYIFFFVFRGKVYEPLDSEYKGQSSKYANFG
ncbi:MAG TPA: hypothetical protein VK559_01245 [Ferruginibacter sp.]|nr:hypothetical protein [Ferruginibacter sp.]